MANKVSEMFEGLTNNFKGMIDANSVVGEPIIGVVWFRRRRL